jgi:3-deoxy-D-manno-octulosonate 8-phosphate phosphatase (KDO 8-P phosphatase)
MDEHLHEKLRKVQLLAMDADGVLTDGRAFYGSEGFDGVSFNVQDGSSIKWLHRYGLSTAIITGRTIGAVRRRAETLGIPHLYQGAKVKMEAYEKLKADTGLSDAVICYIGDDLPDVPVMRHAGVSATVADAPAEVAGVADIITEAPGGEGAVRELAEMLLKAQGHWETLLKRYFED